MSYFDLSCPLLELIVCLNLGITKRSVPEAAGAAG